MKCIIQVCIRSLDIANMKYRALENNQLCSTCILQMEHYLTVHNDLYLPHPSYHEVGGVPPRVSEGLHSCSGPVHRRTGGSSEAGSGSFSGPGNMATCHVSEQYSLFHFCTEYSMLQSNL